MKPFRPGPIGHEFEQSARLAACYTERYAMLLGVEPEQRARRGSRPKHAGGAGGMETAGIRRCRL